MPNLSARPNTNWTCMNCLFPNYDLNNESSEESVRAGLTANSVDVTDLDADSTHLLKGFKIAHLNINRQVNKMDGIRDLLSPYKFDVLALNETFLSTDINDTEDTIPEYRLARKDRSNSTKSTGGGVIVFIRDNIPFAVRSDLMDDRAEILWVEITRNKCKPLLIASVYRPPDYSQRNFFDSINITITIIITSEFKVPEEGIRYFFKFKFNFTCNRYIHFLQTKEKKINSKFTRRQITTLWLVADNSAIQIKHGNQCRSK